MSQSVKQVLNDCNWDQMTTHEELNCTTRLLLSSRDGNYANLLLDWDTELISCQQSSIEIPKYPYLEHRHNANGETYHTGARKKVLDRIGYPKIILN